MKTLEVIINTAGKKFSAHLPELDGLVITSGSLEKLRNDTMKAVIFHIEGLYDEEIEPWMSDEFNFYFTFNNEKQ